MKRVSEKEKKDIFPWFNLLNKKWNSYDAFEDINLGIKPKAIAQNFIYLNNQEFEELLDYLDADDIDALDQLHKLAESELYLLKIIKTKIDFRNKVKFVDFSKKK